MADRAMFRHLGVEPEARPLLGLKSSVHFRADFGPIAEAILVVAAPGPMGRPTPPRCPGRASRRGSASAPSDPPSERPP